MCFHFPVALANSETWFLKKAERRKIAAFELLCYRRSLGITWQVLVTNNEVLHQVSLFVDVTLEGLIVRRRLRFFGYIMRENDGLEKQLFGGYLPLEGEKKKGRPVKRRLDEIKEDMEDAWIERRERVEDREGWRKFTLLVGKGRTRP
jgi:hypothetical protein